MRRIVAGLMMILLVGMVGFGGNPEGWTSDGTTPYYSAIVVQNVSNTAAQVKITFSTRRDPNIPSYEITVLPGTSQTVDVSDAIPGPWGSSAIVTSDVPVVAAQTYLWYDPRVGTQWACNPGGVPAPSTTWYMAEGTTSGGFESYILVQNPGEQPAQVQLTYMTPDGTHEGHQIALEPVSQTKINIAYVLPDSSSISAVVTSDVPVVAQLSTYWNGGASTTTSMGITTPATTWYMAEGNTSGGFGTCVMVQNPGEEDANVTVTCISNWDHGPGPTLKVAPMTHSEFNIADTFPDQSHVTTIVTSDVPVVAVQSMTWDGQGGYDRMAGVTAPSQQWYFAEGRQFSSYSTWVSVQNIGDTSTDVTVTYMTETGTVDGPNLTLNPFGNDSISLPETVNNTPRYSVVVTADRPILAQQGTYWETGVGVHQDVSFGTTLPSVKWHLPATPRSPLLQTEPESGDGSSVADDSDGDGVPDVDDYCPDFPGSPATNGC